MYNFGLFFRLVVSRTGLIATVIFLFVLRAGVNLCLRQLGSQLFELRVSLLEVVVVIELKRILGLNTRATRLLVPEVASSASSALALSSLASGSAASHLSPSLVHAPALALSLGTAVTHVLTVRALRVSVVTTGATSMMIFTHVTAVLLLAFAVLRHSTGPSASVAISIPVRNLNVSHVLLVSDLANVVGLILLLTCLNALVHRWTLPRKERGRSRRT